MTKKFYVSVSELWARGYRVEADSREEAIAIVKQGELTGTLEPENYPEFLENMDEDTWVVIEQPKEGEEGEEDDSLDMSAFDPPQGKSDEEEPPDTPPQG